MKTTEHTTTQPAKGKMGSITIGGKKYNLIVTMGAFLSFKELTGREASTIEQDNASDTIKFIYCILASTARREGRELPFASAEAFADALTPEDFATLNLSI